MFIIPLARVLSLEHLGHEPDQGWADHSRSEYYPSSFSLVTNLTKVVLVTNLIQ